MRRTPRNTTPQTRGARSRSVGDPYGDTKRPSSMFAVRTSPWAGNLLKEGPSGRVRGMVAIRGLLSFLPGGFACQGRSLTSRRRATLLTTGDDGLERVGACGATERIQALRERRAHSCARTQRCLCGCVSLAVGLFSIASSTRPRSTHGESDGTSRVVVAVVPHGTGLASAGQLRSNPDTTPVVRQPRARRHSAGSAASAGDGSDGNWVVGPYDKPPADWSLLEGWMVRVRPPVASYHQAIRWISRTVRLAFGKEAHNRSSLDRGAVV
jgi:hypothetical protein